MSKHHSLLFPETYPFSPDQMTFEVPEPNTSSDQILDWLEDSMSFLECLQVPYSSGADILGDDWWAHDQNLFHDIVNNNAASLTTSTTDTAPAEPIISIQSPPSSLSKKRKPDESDDEPAPRATQNSRKSQSRRINDVATPGKKSVGTKRGSAKTNGNNCNNGNGKEGRWAEQLLNPCAAAITAGDLSRVQHLLYVLHELASPTGDANHRLADHGLRALTHHLSPSSSSPASTSSVSAKPISFTTAAPPFFRDTLMRFDEVSPWFMLPNKIANNSILQILAEQDQPRTLHILDIGVSHGVQWPTLLEALTRLSGGPPPLVRLTVVGGPTDPEQNVNVPFAVGPLGHSSSSHLLGFAKSMKINLQINRLDNHQLENLNAEIIDSSPEETLIVCAQFRLHYLNHNSPDKRTEFLKTLRSLDPKGVILSENNADCGCNYCGDFATRFLRRVDYLWKFLDSSSVAFKGRESDERRMMEGEAAKTLTYPDEMNEGKEKWCERMRSAGFQGKVFAEDTIDEARSSLRKYDNNWEMRVDEKDGCVGLWWKGQPVSFCSLWKSDASE